MCLSKLAVYGMALMIVAEVSGGTLWDGQGGTSVTLIDSGVNWSVNIAPAFDGTQYVTFGTGGATATVNTPVGFLGIAFNRAGNFTVANGAGALTLGARGLCTALPSATSRTYTLAEDVTLIANQAWGVTNSGSGVATLIVSGIIADGATAFGITKSGSGPLVLSGNNSYDGTTTVKTGGCVRISHASALGGTNGVTTVEEGAWLELSGGISVTEALKLSGDQASGYAGALRSTGGSNTWSGAITQGSGTRLAVTSGSLDVTGGFVGSQGLAFQHGGGTTLRLSNKPFVLSSASLYSHGAGLLILNVTGNSWSVMDLANGSVRTDVVNAFPAAATLQLNPNTAVDLNGNSQTVGQFKNANTNAGPRLVTSAAPATLTVNPAGASVTNTYDGRLTGALGLIKNGAGVLILAGTNTASGSVTVSNGTLIVSAPSSLGSSPAIAVDGGTLELRTTNAISDYASLRIASSGAKVNVAAGLTETVSLLYLGDVLQANGTYGASGSGAENVDDTHFAGTGRVQVFMNFGTVWDGGAGTNNTALTAPANWNPDSTPPFNGSQVATFGTGGGSVAINTAAGFLGLRFNRAADVTLASDPGGLTLGSGGIAVNLPDATNRTYTLGANATLVANQLWGITNNGAGIATLVVSGTLTDGAASYGITKSGDGTLVLSGDNSYDGTTVVKTGGVLRVAHANALGSTANGTTVENGGRLELSGDIALAEPLFVSGEGPGSGGVLKNSGASTLSGRLTLAASTVRISNSGSSLTVSGGITSSVNPFFVLNAGGGMIQIMNRPITIGTGTLWSDQSGTLVLGVVSNAWGSTVVSHVTLRTEAANALPAATLLDLSNGGRLDLNGCGQTAGRLQATDASGTEVASTTPATLVLNQTLDTTFDGGLSGALALVKGGSGKLTLTGANRFRGGVTVSNGTLTVASASSLGFGTNIVVAGGTLSLLSEHAIRNTASLRIADGGGAKVSVASGLVERVAQLVFGTGPQINGTWGASGSGAEHIDTSHFSGSGRILVAPATAGRISEYFIAPAGSGTNAGTLLAPFASLEQARDALRLAQQDNDLPAGGVTLWLRAGVYGRTNTFELAAIDSGTVAAPVVYRAYPGETARVHGGRQLPPEWFTVVSNSSPVWARLDSGAHGHVMQADLTAHGIIDFGTLRKRGFGSSSTLAAAELFFDTVPQQLARWPDVGETSAGTTNGWVYTSNPTTGTNFTYTGSRPARWGQAEELWFHGFWKELWADDHVKSASVNTNARLVTLTMAPGYGITNGMPYYAENLLEEITQPGEWVINRSTGILYFWPPSGPAGHEIYLSMLEAPLVRLANVQQVTLRDLSFEMTRGDLLAVTGGDNNRVLSCRLRNAGNYAAKISGSRNGVSGCEIADPGDGGIVLSGGSRATLTGAGNYVRNCTVHGFGRWSWMYTPAVSFSGVGQSVAHNLFYDSPHTAILFGSSNYQLVELNEVRDVCKWSSDAGSIYTGRDLGAHGTIIRNNFIHNIAGQFSGGYGTHGIYLDDCVAGIEVFGNICYKVSGMGIQHGGGRDDLMENNVLVKCGRAMGADARGLTWDMRATWDNLQALPYRGTIWSNAFPQLTAMPTDWTTVISGQWLAPRGTVFSRNIGFSNTVWVSNSGNATSFYREVADNLANSNPLFVDEARLDLALRTSSPAFTIPGFLDIPFGQIGPEADALKELAAWDFPTAEDRAGFSFEALVSPSALTVSGMTALAAPGHPTWAVSVPHAEMDATNETAAVASGDYFEIALAPLAQQAMSLSSLSFDHRKSGTGRGTTLFVRFSANGYAASLGAVTTAGSNAWNASTFTLSGLAPLQNRTAPVTLRIYCYRPSDDSGTQRLSIDNLRVKGAVQTGAGSRVATVFMID